MPDYYGVSQDEIWQREQESRTGMSGDEAIKRAELIDHLIANGNTDLAYDVAKGVYQGNGPSPQPGPASAPYSDTASQRGDQGGYGAPSAPSSPSASSSGPVQSPSRSISEMGGQAPMQGNGLAGQIGGNILDSVQNAGSTGPYAAARSRNNIEAVDPVYAKMGNAMGDQGGMEQSQYRPAAMAKAESSPAAVPYSKMAQAQGEAGGYGGQLTPYQEALMRRGRPVTVPYAPGQGPTQVPSIPTPLVNQPKSFMPGVQISYGGPQTQQPPQPQGFTQGPRGPQSTNFTPTVVGGGPQSMPGQDMPKPRAVVLIQADGSKLIYDTQTGQWSAQR